MQIRARQHRLIEVDRRCKVERAVVAAQQQAARLRSGNGVDGTLHQALIKGAAEIVL